MDRTDRVLVIEDDRDTITLFVEVLRDAGIAAVGASPQRLPAADGYSAVLTDLTFGARQYSSRAALTWVKRLRERYDAPIIVVTGRLEASSDGDLARAASDVVNKPLDIDDLVDRVRRAMRMTESAHARGKAARRADAPARPF